MLKQAARTLMVLAFGLAASSPARAEGWSVTAKPANGVCLAGREEVDKDSKKKSAIAYGVFKDAGGLNLVVTLTSQDWSFPKDEAIDADLILEGEGGHPLALRSKWVGDGDTLANRFDKADPLLTALGGSPEVVLRILRIGSDRRVLFNTPNAAGALDAARACLDAK